MTNLAHFIKEGLRGLLVHKLMSFAAVTVIAACLLITGSFALVSHNLDRALDSLSSQDIVMVFIEDSYSREQAIQVAYVIQEKVPNLASITFVSREELFDAYLAELGDEGLILKDPLKKRTIKLPGAASMSIPLLGTVTAGIPITAVEEIEEYIPVTNLRGSSRDYFALRVWGESMINAGILDGDIVIVRKTPTCRDGDIVVALIEDSATVKRFFKEKGYFRLQPENDAFEPILVREVTILGKVAALIRNYE